MCYLKISKIIINQKCIIISRKLLRYRLKQNYFFLRFFFQLWRKLDTEERPFEIYPFNQLVVPLQVENRYFVRSDFGIYSSSNAHTPRWMVYKYNLHIWLKHPFSFLSLPNFFYVRGQFTLIDKNNGILHCLIVFVSQTK